MLSPLVQWRIQELTDGGEGGGQRLLQEFINTTAGTYMLQRGPLINMLPRKNWGPPLNPPLVYTMRKCKTLFLL